MKPILRTLFLALGAVFSTAAAGEYLNPVDIAPSAETGTAFVALAGPQQIAHIDLAGGQILSTWPLPDEPSGLALEARREQVAVTVGVGEGRVVLFDSKQGRPLRSWSAGFSPCAPVFVARGRQLAVLNRFTDAVSFYDTRTGRSLGRVATAREPIAAVADAYGERLYVGTHMPRQAATAPQVGLTVDIIDVRRKTLVQRIELPRGSTGLQDVALSPDGRWLFVTHVIGHFEQPTNQLERGWMNVNVLSVIDTATEALFSTVSLDDTTLGAANPWGVAVSPDGSNLVVSHTGTHELSRIPLEALIAELVARKAAEAASDGYSDGYDLTLMMRVGRERIALPGLGPRSVATLGDYALVSEYFSGQLAIVDLREEGRSRKMDTISLGFEPEMNEVRHGELRFADARLCFQQWQSCLSCHPSVRADGLNWDLLNDGIGNPKQSKSLLFSHETPPSMAHGVRARAEVAVRAGIRFIQFAEVDEADAKAIDAYLRALEPYPSPALVEGGLSASALRGRKLYGEVGCADCHSGEYFTDQELHRVRHATGASRGRGFDTPTLREVWRTAPYLYDGRANTIEEALLIKDRGVDELSKQQLADLAEYVRSL